MLLLKELERTLPLNDYNLNFRKCLMLQGMAFMTRILLWEHDENSAREIVVVHVRAFVRISLSIMPFVT
jgi:hypothetical protein